MERPAGRGQRSLRQEPWESPLEQQLLAALNGNPGGIPRIAEGAELDASAIDRLLSEHSLERVMEELNLLESQTDHWKAAIDRLRSVFSSHPQHEKVLASHSGGSGALGQRVGAPPCEADDEFWYL